MKMARSKRRHVDTGRLYSKESATRKMLSRSQQHREMHSVHVDTDNNHSTRSARRTQPKSTAKDSCEKKGPRKETLIRSCTKKQLNETSTTITCSSQKSTVKKNAQQTVTQKKNMHLVKVDTTMPLNENRHRKNVRRKTAGLMPSTKVDAGKMHPTTAGIEKMPSANVDTKTVFNEGRHP